MTEQTVEQMNEAIAVFMGLHRSDGTDFGGQSKEMWFNKQGYREVDGGLKYHSDWNQLMPVVEKLEEGFRVDIYGKACKISQPQWTVDIARIHEKKIMAVFIAVYEAIQWYNKNKQNG